jgi:hypothetical protein
MNAPLATRIHPSVVRLRAVWARWWRVAAWLVILLPAYGLARLISDHQVNIPFLDDWMFAPMYEKASRGELTIDDFFVVQMEHRLVVPRIVVVALYYMAPGWFTVQNWLTFGLLLLTGFNAAVLFRRSGLDFSNRWIPMALMSVALFSPVLYQIVLWPMMFQVVIPVAGLTGALAIAGARALPLWVRFAGCACCALTAMLSFASGLLLWPLLVPAVWAMPEPSRPRVRWAMGAAWCLAAAVAFGLYFHNLENSTDPQFAYRAAEGEDTVLRGVSAITSRPLDAALFVVRLLGSPFGRGTSAAMMSQSLCAGWASVVLLGIMAACFWRDRRDAGRWRACGPWFVLAAYSIGAAGLIALGRLWATRGGDNALSPRYVIHAIPLTLALIALGSMCWHRLRERHPRSRGTLAMLAGAAVAAFTALAGVVWLHGAVMMGVWESARLRGATNTLFFKINDRVTIKGEVAGMEPLARRMDDLGLLRRPMLTDNRLNQFRVNRNPPTRSTARFSRLSRLDNGRYRIEGTAALNGRRRVADGVFLTRTDTDGTRRIFHVCQVLQMPLYLGRTLGRDLRFIHHRSDPLEEEDLSSFDTEFTLKNLPTGDAEIVAWAFDYRAWTVFPVGRFRIDGTTGAVRAMVVDPRKDVRRKSGRIGR